MVRLIITVFFVVFLIGGYLFFKSDRKPNPPPKRPVIYNLGVNFDAYNQTTSYAGDFLFDKEKSYFNKIFTEFGINHPHKTESLVVQYIYHLPKGAPLIALADGTVSDVRFQTGARENNDYEIMINFLDAPEWNYGFDHIVNVRVHVGDKIKAGDVLAEAPGGPTSNPNIFSSVELTILEKGSSNIEIKNHCPFVFLEKSVKPEFERKMRGLFTDWETFMNDPNIYNEDRWVYPGCYFEQINEEAGLVGKEKL